MRTLWLLALVLCACDDAPGSSADMGLCKQDVRTTLTLEQGGNVAATCDPDRPLTLAEDEVTLTYGALDDAKRTLALRLPFTGFIGAGQPYWTAVLHIPHDLAHGTWTVGGQGGPFLKVAEGTPLLTGQLTFSRSRDIPDFDQAAVAGGYVVFLTVELTGLKWLQGGTQCGEAEVLVEDLKLRLEETGVIGPCG